MGYYAWIQRDLVCKGDGSRGFGVKLTDFACSQGGGPGGNV